MAAITDVIIFFVGLTTWSEQLPNDCGVKAILPRVVHTSSSTSTVNVAPPTARIEDDPCPADEALTDSHVQNHVAAIVFPKESFVSQEGWGPPKTLKSGNEASGNNESTRRVEQVYLYVPLDGHTVRFITNGATNQPASLQGVKLPQLKQLCPSMQTLTAAYQAPYSGAAAVVALPEGKLQECLSLPAEAEGRLDTRVELRTTETLVISASTMKNTKELHLKPRQAGESIMVMIANVPAPYYEGISTEPLSTANDGLSHVNAYYAMREPSNANCPLSIKDWWDQLSDPDGISLCNAGPFPTSTPAPIISTSLSTSGANFECSNTQWP